MFPDKRPALYAALRWLTAAWIVLSIHGFWFENVLLVTVSVACSVSVLIKLNATSMNSLTSDELSRNMSSILLAVHNVQQISVLKQWVIHSLICLKSTFLFCWQTCLWCILFNEFIASAAEIDSAAFMSNLRVQCIWPMPKTAWLQTFFKISSFVFGRTKKFIQVWNYLRVNKWWQNFHFGVNYHFNIVVHCII